MGRATAEGWRKDWGEFEPPRSWKAEAGIGAAGIAVAAGRVYTLGNSNEQDSVFCWSLDDGEEIWSVSYPCPLDKRMFEGGPACAPTVDVDGGRLFALSHEGELRCLSLADGSERWKRHLVDDFGGRRAQWGYSGSPLLAGGAADCRARCKGRLAGST